VFAVSYISLKIASSAIGLGWFKFVVSGRYRGVLDVFDNTWILGLLEKYSYQRKKFFVLRS